MTTIDLIATAYEKVNAGDERGPLITELTSRLSRAHVWREQMTEAIDQHLIEDDGSDMIPDHVRVSNMLRRMSYSANVPRQVSLAGGNGGSNASGEKALGLLFCQQALCLSA